MGGWGRPISRIRSSRFLSCINHCSLLELGFNGAKYTWSNHRRSHNELILERLDRCFVNESWLEYDPNAIVTHLPKTYSDHNALLIPLFQPSRIPKQRIFRIETD